VARAVLQAGQTFARYVIEAPIGEGGMGEVYRAFDGVLRRKVALKILHPDLAVPDAAARLVREARAAAALAHPNTVAIHDLGEIDGAVFLVMELIAGATLRAFVGDASVPVTRKIRWLVDVARGLAAAHKAGLIHRDVKPTNIMVSDDGIVKVLDFGLAKPLEANSFHTDAGIVVGTPRYMAPELFSGTRADERTDQYAFGVTAYELLSGVHPGGPTGKVPAALDALVPEVGAGVARIVARTIARDPAQRYASMSDVANALEEELGGVSTARVSEQHGAVVATRREGAPDAALALAPTELPGGRALGASRTLASPVGTELEPPRRRASATVVLGVVAFVVIGAFAASRVLDTHATTATAVDASADVASTDGAPLELDDDATAVSMLVAPEGGDDASPATVGVDPSDAGTDADDAEAGPPDAGRRILIDDFVDPWTKPSTVGPAR